MYHSQFRPVDLKRALGSKRVNRVPGAVPRLFAWNNFSADDKQRREITRISSRESSSIRNDSESSFSMDLDISVISKVDDCNVSVQVENELVQLQKENEKLSEENKQLKLENSELKELLKQYNENTKLIREKFIKHITDSDENCSHYTGITSLKRLEETFKYCNPGNNRENMRMPTSSKEKAKQGRPSVLTPFEGYILTLCKLRQNFSFEHLCFLLQVALSTASKTFLMWISFLYLRIGGVSIWPTRDTVKMATPDSMKQKFPNCRVILDCTEIFVGSPSKLQLHKIF